MVEMAILRVHCCCMHEEISNTHVKPCKIITRTQVLVAACSFFLSLETLIILHYHQLCVCAVTYVTHSRKRGPFPQKSVCELDLSADSAKSVVHARENRLTLARSVPKLQSFKYRTVLTLVSRYRRLFQSCRQVQVVSVYYRK